MHPQKIIRRIRGMLIFFIIALAFIGPYRDPVKNKWVIQWAMLACVAVFPLALIAGPIRGIPWYHIVIDCCFGIIGLLPLGLVHRWIDRLEHVKLNQQQPSYIN